MIRIYTFRKPHFDLWRSTKSSFSSISISGGGEKNRSWSLLRIERSWWWAKAKMCIFPFQELGVSENSGTPKSSILIGFSIINHPTMGVPLFLETPNCDSLFLQESESPFWRLNSLNSSFRVLNFFTSMRERVEAQNAKSELVDMVWTFEVFEFSDGCNKFCKIQSQKALKSLP